MVIGVSALVWGGGGNEVNYERGQTHSAADLHITKEISASLLLKANVDLYFLYVGGGIHLLQRQTGEEVTLLPGPENYSFCLHFHTRMLMDYKETAVDKDKSGLFALFCFRSF